MTKKATFSGPKKRRPPRVTKVVTLEQAFKPQVKVRATRDLNGWANRSRGIKWHIGAGSIGCLDEDKAREFVAKGFVELIEGNIKPVSEDEAAEFLSQVTTIRPGGSGG